ncbi:hypothetical protein [Kitasatospora phosalacinea]|uniref:Uncharacterized protein n=1 Tax=Kitasatospora phosalacinea TaxID=2065 RepID=A0A9W6UL44_9ACTN|nr:hypothetical protein [Kitasatospora phosalacinea]GLW52124.1 hypothetical protein Kpho01_01350 [Kitasatospora phosalacinea]
MRAPLSRHPGRPGHRHAPDGRPPWAAFGSFVLAAAATLGLGGPAAAELPTTGLPTVDVVPDSRFAAFPPVWNCSSHSGFVSWQDQHWVDGRPTADDFAECTVQVAVQPNSTYALSASVRGPYVFVGTRGTDTGGETVMAWSNDPEWNGLTAEVSTGPHTTSLTVYFHGWYGQEWYEVRQVSLVGPGHPRSSPATPCASQSSAGPSSAAPASTPGTARPPQPAATPSPGSTENDTWPPNTAWPSPDPSPDTSPPRSCPAGS